MTACIAYKYLRKYIIDYAGFYKHNVKYMSLNKIDTLRVKKLNFN